MNKTLIVLFLAGVFSSNSFADRGWTSTTKSVLSKITDADKEYSSEAGGVYKILYNEKFERLERNIQSVEVLPNGKYLQVNRTTEKGYEGQCVSLVKALSNYTKPTYDWKPKKQLGVDKVQLGRMVAVFNQNGKYAYHTGIYIGEDSDGIWLFDQNWVPGIVTIHKVKFRKLNKGKGDGDVNNAYSYFTFD